jgi:uncharacterized membrane protein
LSQERIAAIDATRGTAMFFVFLSHFVESYIRPTGHYKIMSILYRISMVASPTFMLISGIVLGYLYETHKENFGPMRESLIGRGLFLLTIGRLFIVIAHIPLAGGIREAFGWGFITDAIGISVIVGSLIVGYVKPLARLYLGLGLFMVSWWLILGWIPPRGFFEASKDLLFGPVAGYGDDVYADIFPLIPWLSLYIVGSYLGSTMGLLQIRQGMKGMSTFVGRIGWGAISLVAVVLAFRLFIGLPRKTESTSTLFFLFYSQKLPPTILYFLFYGGIGLIILYFFLRYEKNVMTRRIIHFTEIIGKSSLFVFILQYYVYFTFIVLLKLEYTLFWPCYFLASISIIYLITRFWYDRGFNKYLTIPYSRLLQHGSRAVGTRGRNPGELIR